MTIAVTGATGNLGRLVLDALLARGVAADQIIAIGRSIEKLADFAEQGVQVRTADYGQPETIAAAIAGAEKVLLISGSEVGGRIAQHATVIDAAKEAGVKLLAYTSLTNADSTPHLLAPEHKATEQLIRESGIPFTILRNNMYTENSVGLVQAAAATGAIVSSAGEGRMASASRKDYAEAAAVVLTESGHEGAVYELTGDVAWTPQDLATAASEVLGTDVAYRAVTAEEHAQILTGAGFDKGTVGFFVGLDANTRDNLLAETTGELARLIGRPTTLLVEGLAEALGDTEAAAA
ncbi:SDR family oxidoreductase [Salinibacterium sp. ZJ454]|uniref:SDR family oxidoreductase n=1 Tax=Salinibacterium sp. ZJ454 TaxID=2708339 RepID=UPI0014236826|nr:SDR family oxidoreductase [Salinibacterium sp. ZJ454]